MPMLYLAPMEELTGYVFRNVQNRHFGGVDKYFTPFISPDNRITKTRSFRELIPENNVGLNVVPQLLTNDSDQFYEGASLIASLGYKEININFGCPSNTVAAKRKGSGILRDPELMDRFLDGVFCGSSSILIDHPDIRISAKMRVGYNDTSDLDRVLPVMARYPFFEITVHPRLKKDMYNGKPRMDMFDRVCENLSTDIVYNGDIFSADEHTKISDMLSEKAAGYKCTISAVMIGRGAVSDPGIFRQIRTGRETTRGELYDFLSDLFETYKAENGAGNALAKLKEVWTYASAFITDERERSRTLKSIIKSRTEAEYKDAITVARFL